MKSIEIKQIFNWKLLSFSSSGNIGVRGINWEPTPHHQSVARVPNSVFVVDNDRCFGCAACVSLCPVDALVLEDILAIVDEPSCTHCNFCIPHCPVHALSIIQIN